MQDPFLDTAVQMPQQTMVQTGNYLEWPSCAGLIQINPKISAYYLSCQRFLAACIELKGNYIPYMHLGP